MEGTNRYLRIPEDVAEKYRIRAERERTRKARYESNHPNRKHGENSGTHKPLMAEREFCIWDGEGPKDTGYSLFGNSKGMEICYRHLRTKHCLNLIIEAGKKHPYMIHVGFGFTYDVSCILWELSWRHLSALYVFGETQWRDFRIQHVPRKWFQVSRGNVSVKIYDVQSFFATSLVGALTKWRIGPWGIGGEHWERTMVEEFKDKRAEFLWKEIDPITQYMRLELKYTAILMESLRKVFLDSGYCPHSWHGPGALAREAFKRHDIYASMAISPVEVRIAARYGFIGGRFELFQAGWAGQTVYTADINSAYPFYCSQLPNLARGEWRRTRGFEPGKFAIYKISYAAKPDSHRIYPLPFRDKNGEVTWPNRTESWYWQPEAELVKDDPNATFIEGWVFDEIDPSDRPFAFVLDYYQRRKLLKAIGNPAEYTFKLILNSIYGQLAQRTGWDKKRKRAPRTHQLEWAGYITSACRAAIYKQAILQGDSLISIDTDGVTGLKPFDWLENGTELGEWELTQYDDGIFWQSGMYALKDGDEWTKAKTRGIPKGTYSVEDLFERMDTLSPLKLTKKVFISYGLALNGQKRQLNNWIMEPHEYSFGGNGKRQHCQRKSECDRHKNGNLHKLDLEVWNYGSRIDPIPTSMAHSLPWLKPDDKFKHMMRDLVLYDRNDLDMEDEWIINEFETEMA